ncbi:Uncharacterized protein ALO72_04556, partial [Pseudomonas syringae pv. delphinii]
MYWPLREQIRSHALRAEAPFLGPSGHVLNSERVTDAKRAPPPMHEPDMEFIRTRIETQVISLTGLALGQLDLENPKGDPGLFGPQSVCWKVHGDFTSMLVGGISALML